MKHPPGHCIPPVKHGNDMLILINANAEVIYDSPAIQETFGYPPGAMLGKQVFLLSNACDLLAWKINFQKTINAPGLSIPHTVQLRTENGEYISVEGTFTNLLDVPGINAIVAYYRPATGKCMAQEALRQSEIRFQALLENSNDGIALYTACGELIFTSPVACRMTGYQLDEMKALDRHELVHPDDSQRTADMWQDLLSNPGGSQVLEIRFRHKNGHWIWIENTRTNLLNHPFVGAIVSNFRDISERKLHEQKLKESEAHLLASQRLSHVGSWEIDFRVEKGPNPFRWSDECYRIFGYEPGEVEITAELFFSSIPPNELPFIKTTIYEAIKSEKVFDIEHSVTRPDGTIRIVHERSEMVFDDKTGKPLKLIGIVQDITERSQINQTLKESESLLLSSQRIANIGSWEVELIMPENLGQNKIRWSDECYRIYGYTPGEVEITPELFFKAILPEDRPIIEAALQKALDTGEDYSLEHAIVRPCGERRVVHGRSKIVFDKKTGRPVKMIGTVQDITDHRKAEKQLRETEQNLRQIVDLIPYSVFCKNKEGRVLFGNLRHAELAGATPAELLNKHQYEWTDKTEADTFLKDDLEVINSGQPKFIPEEPYTDFHGNTHILQTTKVPFVLAGTNEIGVLGISIEVTEIKRTQELLQNQYALLKGLIESSDAPIYSVDTNNHYTSFNSAHITTMKNLFGQDIELGKNMLDYVKDAVIAERVKRSHEQVLDSKEVWSEVTNLDNRWYEVTKHPLRNSKSDVIGVSVFYKDITERKLADEEIRRINASLEQRVADRTKELEAFSYSVSHDLRSPLRSVDGFSSLLLRKYGDTLDTCAQEYLQLIRGASQHMGQIIEGLLALSRMSRAEMKKEQVNLSQTACSIAIALQKSQPSRKVEFNIMPELVVNADPNLMHVLIENLLGNAWKYTSKQPEAIIELAVKHETGQPVFFIRDNGAGFDMVYAEKLFKSFQRLHTSDDFEGIGIGLATVQRIIQRHGGKVWAKGKVNEGAAFYFTLGA